jgi:hypothetical protein
MRARAIQVKLGDVNPSAPLKAKPPTGSEQSSFARRRSGSVALGGEPDRRNAPWERSRARLALRLGAGALVLFVGADHYYEYSAGGYSVLPTIGSLFLLTFVSGTVGGLVLLAPLEKISHRFGRPATWLAALGGFALGATSLIALLISEQTPLFGFMELNYRPAIVVALVSEAAAAASCALVLVLDLRALYRREGQHAAAAPIGGLQASHRRRP